jgi:hypothetical protein
MTGVIIDYDIVSASGVQELVRFVKDRMKLGWQPDGPVFSMGEKDTYIRQKVVKYDMDPHWVDTKNNS